MLDQALCQVEEAGLIIDRNDSCLGRHVAVVSTSCQSLSSPDVAINAGQEFCRWGRRQAEKAALDLKVPHVTGHFSSHYPMFQ
jgi:hypothetical protein